PSADYTASAARRSEISWVENPQSRSTASLCSPALGGGACTAPGVRLKRGAGAGCVTPSTSTKVLRSALWGWRGASSRSRIGAKQTSLPSMTLHHSACVFDLKICASLERLAGQVSLAQRSLT